MTGGVGRVCAGIRAHRFGEPEETLHRFLRQYFAPEDIVVVVDETRGSVTVPAEYRKIGFDRPALEAMALYHDFARIGWLCGDYFYYVMHRRLGADAYWLIEPDVRFTFAQAREFFRHFEPSRADLLACGFGTRKRSWWWYRVAKPLSADVYGCYFPITRLSATAIAKLLPMRQEASRRMTARGSNWNDYANDEAFVATSAMKLGLSCEDMVPIQPEALRYVSTHFPFLWPNARSVIPADRVVHPALDEESFWPAFKRHVRPAIGEAESLWDFAFAATAGTDTKHRKRVRAELQACMGEWFDFYFDLDLRKTTKRPPWD